ncbi:1-(5-phosphoribosyl)-5-[(5-phosphoribosylamino)methylideneamino] imidazole-4-carboxamide isomerase [Breznakia blatticola]|uniref:1-(5-phosphoribosyl)-5-[(5-phosphoribosylamino)methylideneamino] imidazole-4-carboxamide isomerase n=1 Tax=Breznakia blatticola TaxID=1754012 RepID=A0A4R8A355_9FIRM|nr:1-(5-phosphoribosyl)-5-[(5-phosphoribosylamino)methylideneamino]imidazole-4-carboxamide isomerase [Breznakia blatticola]TDW24685.1 1-(5-phosphoribosyl)-5-[(5-phosphoribosylamino)methylideneamino] imidazole-4-carboxamide isomerase [Breznakia blatticola]
MIILPAIDILDGKPVRLYKGDYNQVERVDGSILELAKQFEAAGAQYIHLVDLDGAKDGMLKNAQAIVEVAKTLSIPIEIGGGIRNMEAIDYYLKNGVSRVILGTVALENPDFLAQALASYGDKIAVGVDFKDGYVYGRGWLEASNEHYLDFTKKLENMGVKTIIVTDISKDGTLSGINASMYQELQNHVNMQIIASGGIKDIDDIAALAKIKNFYGAITGKAMYHKTLDLKQAIAVAKGEISC